MNLGQRVDCGNLTASSIGLSEKRVGSIIATSLDATSVKIPNLAGNKVLKVDDNETVAESAITQTSTTTANGGTANLKLAITNGGITVDTAALESEFIGSYSQLHLTPYGKALSNGLTISAQGTGRVGLRTTTPSYDVDVDGDVNFTGLLRVSGASGSAGQVLTSNGSAAPSWADATGGGNDPVYQLLMLKGQVTHGYSNSIYRRLGDGSNDTDNEWVETLSAVSNYSRVSSVTDGSLIDSTEGAFKAPRDGIYEIRVTFVFEDATSSFISHFYSNLVKKETGGTEYGISHVRHRLRQGDGSTYNIISHSSIHLMATTKLLQNELVFAEYLTEGSGTFILHSLTYENRACLGTHMMVKSID